MYVFIDCLRFDLICFKLDIFLDQCEYFRKCVKWIRSLIAPYSLTIIVALIISSHVIH